MRLSKVLKPRAECGVFFGVGSLLLPALLVVMVWFAFSQALPGVVQFDDKANLSGLDSIETLADARQFVLEGRAGPSGRPISLGTFALQYYQWPDNPEALLEWNIAFHAVNTLLVFWLVYLLFCDIWPDRRRVVAGAFFVAATWAVMPFLNSAVLLIIQRMTLLSATFSLLALIGFVKSLPRGSSGNQLYGSVGALILLYGFGAVGIFAKENAALVVLLAIPVFHFFLSPSIYNFRVRALVAAGLYLPALVLVVFVLTKADWSACSELQRGFGVVQRLGAEGHILADYLFSLFVPSMERLNPFRMQFIDWSAAYVLSGWVVLVGLMLLPWLLYRFGWRALSFGMAFFLLGHFMESGVIPLEPYFAHRNYVPAVGLIIGVVVTIMNAPVSRYLLIGAGLSYLAVIMSVTIANTSLWGNSELAAEVWYKEEPGSDRSVLNVAYEVEEEQGLFAAQSVLDDFVDNQRDSVGLRLQGLVSGCALAPSVDYSDDVEEVIHAIRERPYESWSTDVLGRLDDQIANGAPCKGVGDGAIERMANAFLAVPAYRCSKSIVHNLEGLKGFVSLRRDAPKAALRYFLSALEASVSFSVASMAFDLAETLRDEASAKRIAVLVENSEKPSRVTEEEWLALKKHIKEVLRN